ATKHDDLNIPTAPLVPSLEHSRRTTSVLPGLHTIDPRLHPTAPRFQCRSLPFAMPPFPASLTNSLLRRCPECSGGENRRSRLSLQAQSAVRYGPPRPAHRHRALFVDSLQLHANVGAPSALSPVLL